MQQTQIRVTLFVSSILVAVSIIVTISAIKRMDSIPSNPKSMATNFIEYAYASDLSEDEIYTIELLIEWVRDKFDEDYYSGDAWMNRSDARESPDYKPSFKKAHVPLAAPFLKELKFLTSQASSKEERPVRDITAFKYFTGLTSVILTGQEIRDLRPLTNCGNLESIHLRGTRLTDISAIASLTKLENVTIGGNGLDDYSVLEKLPRLRELEISAEALASIECLPEVIELEVSRESTSFADFPEMPKLEWLQNADVESLDGIQRFKKLNTLANFRGNFSSLAPLAELPELTHVHAFIPEVTELAPLSKLLKLRSLTLFSAPPDIRLNLDPVPPALHELIVKSSGDNRNLAEHLQSHLTPWDVEFLSAAPRHTPSLRLEVVSQKSFDHFDSNEKFGIGASDTNLGLLTSELEWVQERIEALLSPHFSKDEDYAIPYRWGHSRSFTVCLLSSDAAETFPRLVLGMQKVLATTHRDWIIYFQADGTDMDFIVWVYPDHIVTTPEYEDVVRKLIQPR